MSRTPAYWEVIRYDRNGEPTGTRTFYDLEEARAYRDEHQSSSSGWTTYESKTGGESQVAGLHEK